MKKNDTIKMRFSKSGRLSESSRKAFIEVWQHLGWEEVTEDLGTVPEPAAAEPEEA